MLTIYILKLEKNKYYVGKTTNINNRILQHLSQTACEWTKKYKAISIDKTITNADSFDEDKWTIKYMALYGIDNVRGGTFSKIDLSDSDKKTIRKMIAGVEDACYICGKKGHFSRDCPFKNLCERCGRLGHNTLTCYAHQNKWGENLSGTKSQKPSSQFYRGVGKIIINNYYGVVVCRRCGRDGHPTSKCYAFRHKQGYKLS